VVMMMMTHLVQMLLVCNSVLVVWMYCRCCCVDDSAICVDDNDNKQPVV
jgi:hypothetical protein